MVSFTKEYWLPCPFPERILDSAQHNRLGPAVFGGVLEALSFCEEESEEGLQAEWRRLAARVTEALNSSVCSATQEVDIALVLQCYEAWARAPAHLGLLAGNRAYNFRKRQEDYLLCPFRWGERIQRPTPRQAARLVVAMATVAAAQGDFPGQNSIEFLFSTLKQDVDTLSTAEMESVASALEHFRWGVYQRYCQALITVKY